MYDIRQPLESICPVTSAWAIVARSKIPTRAIASAGSDIYQSDRPIRRQAADCDVEL